MDQNVNNKYQDQAYGALFYLQMMIFFILFIGGRISYADSDREADRKFETAMASYNLERWEEAADRFYEFMVEAPFDPRNDRAQFYAARAFHQRNYLNRAIDEYSYMLEDFPESIYFHLACYYRGMASLDVHEKQAAYDDLNRFVNNYRPERGHRHTDNELMRELYHSHRDALFKVADYFLDNEEYEKAVSTYMRLPRPLEAFRRVVNVRYDLGQYDRILEMIEGLEGDNRHEAFKYMLEFYAEREAYRRLNDVFRELLRESDPDNRTDDLVWHAKNMLGRFGGQHLENALESISDYYPRLARRAEYELAQRNWQNSGYQDQMELFVIKYRGESPRNVHYISHRVRLNDVDRVLRWRGIMLERAGKPEEARQEYRRMRDSAFGHWYAAESYHGEYAREKDREAAIEEYENFRRAFHSENWAAKAQWRIAKLYQELEKWDAAAEAYRHFQERWSGLRVTTQDDHAAVDIFRRYIGEIGDLEEGGRGEFNFAPAALLEMGDMYRNIGEYDEALMAYQSLVSNYPRSNEAPGAIYRTALSYERLDEHETAINVLKSCLRQYGESRAAADASTRLQQRYDIADPYVEDAMDFSDIVN